MKRFSFKRSPLFGLGIIIFVALVGALGYNYVINYKAQVAVAPKGSSTQSVVASSSTKAPDVETKKDLDTALSTLDASEVGATADQDLSALEAELNNL
jgi:cytoskeletal protein RodZ